MYLIVCDAGWPPARECVHARAQVVCDDGKNEKMVMKNAHEIAILGALSHPNIVQAYTCLTDVQVRELLQQSMKSTHHTVLQSSAYRYLAAMEDKTCHIEVGGRGCLGMSGVCLHQAWVVC